MPSLETSPIDQRKQFIADCQRGPQSVTKLADHFEISRKTAYKWIDRHEQDGANGLADHSRRPSRFREEYNNERPHEALSRTAPSRPRERARVRRH